MTTHAVQPAAPSAGSQLVPAVPQERPSFLETTIRISAVATALFYAGLAIWAYPVLGLTCFVTTGVVAYSRQTGVPVQDLVDGFCQRCIPATPPSAQPVGRSVQPVFVPSGPGSRQGTITLPVTIVAFSPEGSPRAQSPDLAQRAVSPQPPTSRSAEQRPSSAPGNQGREFMVLGNFPDVSDAMLRSVYIPNTSEKPV